MLKKNSTVLFQGDSVTDCGRSREDDALLGSGYPALVARALKEKYPDGGFRILNRGVSGNRSIDLVGRWQSDCIDLKPDYLSILIGINDTWRRYDSNDPTSPENYEKRMRTILEDTLKNTAAEILLLMPFVLDVNDFVHSFREDLCFKQEVLRRLAAEYNLKLVDLDGIFTEKCKAAPPEAFSADGVHPLTAGHEVIAAEWLRAFDA